MGKNSNLITVTNQNKPGVQSPAVKYCASFLCLSRGLMFRKRLESDDGLLLVFGRESRIDSSITMFFVPFDLGVFWINTEMKVVDKVIAKAWKPAYVSAKPAQYVLEIHPEHWNNFEVGDTVEFEDA
jgi:uncharacterized membrane protein (UPF0127 family)